MIHSTSNIHGYNRTDAIAGAGAKHAPAVKNNSDDSERLSSSNTSALREALSNSPEVRPEVLERARKLAIDPNYPPRELIARLSKLMVESREPAE